uniref:Uncharacterized protein n=1 Tax=Timema poppense TaxID=170557 RepID=A0A7R9HB23_TIMPO|nr:unnamed protein product [Timema poppensis]
MRTTVKHLVAGTVKRTVPYKDFCVFFINWGWLLKELNNEAALSRAKANVDRYFPVVGVLEQLNETLAVLENKLPYFFKGVQSLYFQELLEPHKNRNRKRPQIVRADVRKIVESSLHKEYDFYYWLQARLLLQYRSERTFPTPTVAKYLKPNMSFL